MAEKRSSLGISDEQRDAGRYYRLLLALDRAVGELRALEKEGMPAMDTWLGQMLPHLAEGLDADQAFVTCLGRNRQGQEWLELVAVHPPRDLVGKRLPCTGRLCDLVRDGGYLIADPLGEAAPAVVPELRLLGATSAVLVRMQAAGRSYVVGVCDKRNPEDAFLAMDGKTLSHIVELVGVGAHFGEQRRRELQNIQATAAAISAELDLDELLPLIAERAAEVFGASATSLMLWDKGQANLVIRAGVNLSEKYRLEQRIPAAEVARTLKSLDEPRAIVTSDLLVRPYGRRDLIVEEGLRSALTAPLLDESRHLTGILNVYSKGELRSFDVLERELAQILAHQGAIAIRNAQLRRRELEGLFATSQALRTALDPSRLYDLVTGTLQDAFSAPATSLMLWDLAEENLVIRAFTELSPDYVREQRIPRARVMALSTSEGSWDPRVVPDLRKDPFGQQALYVKEGLCSVLVAPLVVGKQPIGLLKVYSKGEPRLFTRREIELAGVFANQVSAAIEMIELQQQSQDRGDQLAALDRIALDIAGRLDTQELLRAMVWRATELLRGISGLVYLWHEAGQTFRLEAAYNLPTELEGKEIDPQEGVVGEVWRTRKPVAVPDYRHWPQRLLFLDSLKLTAVVGVPILSGERCWGVVVVLDTRQGREFNQAEQELLVGFANHAAVALDNAYAYSRLKETGDYLDGLVNSSLDGVIAIDEAGRIQIYSVGAGSILGYRPEEVLDGNMRVDWLYGDLEEARSINRQLHREGKIDYRETQVRSSDGTWVPVVLSAVLLRDTKGKPAGSVGYFKDLRPLRKAEAELKLVLETVQAVAGTRSLDEGLTMLAGRMVAAVGVTFCHILLRDQKEGQILRVGAACAIPRPNGPELLWEPDQGRRVNLGENQAMRFLLDLPKPRVFRPSDSIGEKDILSHIVQEVGLRGNLGSALVLPLRTSRETLGICTLGEMRNWERSPFDPERIQLADSLASQTAIHIDRMWAHETAERRVVQLESLRAVGEQATEALAQDIKAVLTGIAEGACQVSGAECAVIYPYYQNPGIYDVRHIASHGLMNPKKPFSPKLRRESKGMVNDALQERRVVVDDVTSGRDRSGRIHFWPEESKFLQREAVRSFVGMGLWVGGEPMGALFVNYRRHHQLQDEEMEMIEIFANQAAMIIYQARVAEREHKKSQAIQWLHEITRLMGSIETIQPIWQEVLDGALEITNACWGCVLPRDPSSNELVLDVDTGPNASQCRCRRVSGSAPCALVRQVLESRQSRLILDTSELSPSDDCRQLCSGEVASLLAVPILPGAGQEALGVVLLESPERVAFGIDDQELVENLANYGGLAAQSVTRYLEIQEHARLREGLLKAGQAITALRSSSELLQSIADSARTALGCDVVTLYTYDQRRQEIGHPPLCSGHLEHPTGLKKLGQVDPRSVVARILDRGQPYYADDSRQDPWFSSTQFAPREGVCSSAGIPLLIGEERVGVFFVNYRHRHPFAPQEKAAVELFATQAAIAIHNARLYEGLQKRTTHLKAVIEAGKVVMAGLERERIMEDILYWAVESVTGAAGSKADLGTIQLYDEESQELVFECVYPPHERDSLVAVLGDRYPTNRERAREGGIGVIGRAFETRKPQNVPDVSQDGDYVEYRPSTQSELAVPLLDGEVPLGVLNVESDKLEAFDDADVEALTGLGDLAVVALKNAKQAERLDFSTSVALMSAEGTEMAHDVNREVGNIRRAVYILQRRTDLAPDVRETLQRVDQSAKAMAWVELGHPVAEADRDRPRWEAPLIDQVVQAEINRVQNLHADLLLEARLTCEGQRALIPVQRLGRLVRHLITNAANAVPPKSGHIMVSTLIQGSQVEVQVEDSGNGVPLDQQPHLFKKPIRHPDGRLGYGLLLVRFWAEQYGGSARLVRNRPGEGACFAFALPLADPAATVAS